MMRGGQSAEVENVASKYALRATLAAQVLFQGKWKLQILCAMRSGPIRLGKVTRLIPGASKKVLTQHLRQLEADGIVVRTDKSDLVLHVEYELADNSREDLLALLDHLAKWGMQYLGTPKDQGM
jgi:DNA-binding HxlR family transcriptional regulator